MTSCFPEGSKAKGLFSVGPVKTTISYDAALVTAAIAGLNEAQNQVLSDHISAIDNENTVNVESIFSKMGLMTDAGKQILSSNGDTSFSGASLDYNHGGGVTYPVLGTAGDIFIAYNLQPTEGLVSYSDRVVRPTFSGELYYHELGYAISVMRGGFINDKGMVTVGMMSVERNQLLMYDASIQMGNTWLRAVRAPYLRMTHGVGHTPEFKPDSRPDYKQTL